MKLLIDCDILLDIALKRDPYFEYSSRLLDWAEKHPGQSAVAWHTLSNLVYLCDRNAAAFIEDLLEFIDVPGTDADSMRFALELSMKDLEDAMQVAAAELFGAQIIATRNLKDYSKSPIKAMAPRTIIPLLEV